MASYDFFINLKNFIKGKINPTEFISNTSNSDNVEEIRLDRNKLPQSKIYFDFGNISNVFELLNISDDDAWFYNVITNPYSSYDPIDRSSAVEDFRSGYGLWYALNEENMDKFKLISKVLVPMEFDLNSDKFSNELYDKLYDYSKKELTNIIDAYTNERNNEITTLARDKMEEDLKLKKVAKDDDTKPMTTVDVRFDGYVTVNVPWTDYDSVNISAMKNKSNISAILARIFLGFFGFFWRHARMMF
jgi:hypothetical protein